MKLIIKILDWFHVVYLLSRMRLFTIFFDRVGIKRRGDCCKGFVEVGHGLEKNTLIQSGREKYYAGSLTTSVANLALLKASIAASRQTFCKSAPV